MSNFGEERYNFFHTHSQKVCWIELICTGEGEDLISSICYFLLQLWLTAYRSETQLFLKAYRRMPSAYAFSFENSILPPNNR